MAYRPYVCSECRSYREWRTASLFIAYCRLFIAYCGRCWCCCCSCRKDRVQVYDVARRPTSGGPPTRDTLVGVYCGNKLPGPQMSEQNSSQMKVLLITDKSGQQTHVGFRAKYEFVKKTPDTETGTSCRVCSLSQTSVAHFSCCCYCRRRDELVRPRLDEGQMFLGGKLSKSNRSA